jgi:predicted anti-sigma-YlaC factor YlaD
MTEHDAIRTMLALAAAGVMDADDLRRVDRHTQECADCRKELDRWMLYARGLKELPQPVLPADLILRTEAAILREHEVAAGRRRDRLMLAALAVFSWVISLAFWALARALTGGVLDVFGTNWVSAGPWFLVSTVVTWITAGTAAVTLGHRREIRRVL